MKRYEDIAELIAADIRSGRLAPGTRLPSIRKVMAQHRVSPSTAFQAYYLLEKRGLVRARERSGYFVAGAGQTLPPEPAASLPPQVSAPVDISELVFSVLGAVQHRNILPLGSAFPSPKLFPLPRLAKSLASTARFIDPWDTVASLPPGNTGLRQQIALRYLGMGMPQAPENIIVTNGALEALNLCLAAVAQPGDVIAIESPGFYAATQAIERLGMQALEIPVHPKNGLDLDALAAALERHPVRACWFMTSFQNPMGASMDEARKQALVALLARHQIPLIEDDVYGELYFGKHPPLPAKAFDTQGLVMHCSSFSKTLAPGYRIGWVSPGRFGQRIERLKLMTTLSASVPAQVAIADYLQTGAYDKHLRKLRHALESQLACMNRALVEHFPAGVRVSRPSGGYFLWVEFPDDFDTLDLHRRAIEQGISLAPGPIFSASRRFRNCLRLNYGSPWSEDFEQGMALLGRLASSG
ncbi:PLP-dependent aminotransferase family protein [Jeongeupia sp. USM3]|uniref:aminotransferase-like domain-containing protein n=1 Tax=Jeongeupia sp. USM3 TaxID=1906741 RepID=UPI00089DE543|nr:PLP-dependent aminotransferase family protein [Jeongeupia sp. USM3]AOY02242.1 GntR family transcriptional regulator [Jeongeupia sp. USM3]